MAEFALIVLGKKVLAESGTVMAEDDERFLVLNEDSGWVEATSTRFRPPTERLPKSVKIWESRAAAEAFAKQWKGHPWWCVPNGSYEVLELTPITAVVGYKLKPAAGVALPDGAKRDA